jgi:hypothetical protein
MKLGRCSGRADRPGSRPEEPVKVLLFIAMLSIGVCGTSLDGLARKMEIPCETLWSAEGFTVVQSDNNSSLAGLENSSPESFVFVEFTHSAELPPGSLLEVWPRVEGDVPPWDLPPEQLPYDRVLWVMDERTGSLARFDVTPIARAWARGELPNAGLVVRLVNSDEVATSMAPPSLTLEAPALTYHDTTPDRKPSGETLDPGNGTPSESPEEE